MGETPRFVQDVMDGRPVGTLIGNSFQSAAPGIGAHPLQRIVNTVWQILTSSSQDIAAQFGESRVRCDADRINYVLELLASHVTEDVARPPRGDAQP